MGHLQRPRSDLRCRGAEIELHLREGHPQQLAIAPGGPRGAAAARPSGDSAPNSEDHSRLEDHCCFSWRTTVE